MIERQRKIILQQTDRCCGVSTVGARAAVGVTGGSNVTAMPVISPIRPIDQDHCPAPPTSDSAAVVPVSDIKRNSQLVASVGRFDSTETKVL